MAFSAKWLESCGKAIAGRLPEAPTGNHDGRCILDLVSVARPRSRGGTQPPSRCRARVQRDPSTAGPRKTSPGNGPPHTQPRKVRPAQPLQRLFREKLRPARHKTPISVHFEHAGRTFSRTGHSHVATMQPMTPLQPLMQASMKPPSPMLAPEQQPLKPPSPLQPKNAPKTPISHPQRRRRFQMRIGMGEQRRWRFQMRIGMGEQRRRQYPTTAWPVCGLRLRHQQVPMCPLLRKLACNSMMRTFKNNQKR